MVLQKLRPNLPDIRFGVAPSSPARPNRIGTRIEIQTALRDTIHAGNTANCVYTGYILWIPHRLTCIGFMCYVAFPLRYKYLGILRRSTVD